MNQKNFKPDLVLKGNQGEQIVSFLLRKDGYFVTCLSDINEQGIGGAPGMKTDKDFLILPDLQAALRGKIGYCEVKWKTEATFTRITQREEHGVDKRNWDHYYMVQSETGIPVYLFIYERKTGAVLYSLIEHLSGVSRYTSKMGKGGMIFFPRASYALWGRVAQLGGHFAVQLDMFERMNLEGEGDKLFGVVRHINGILSKK